MIITYCVTGKRSSQKEYWAYRWKTMWGLRSTTMIGPFILMASDTRSVFSTISAMPKGVCLRLRVYKRKQKQAMVFRSFENYRWLCDSLSVVYLLRQESGNVYCDIANIYGRKRSRPKKKKERPAVDIGT